MFTDLDIIQGAIKKGWRFPNMPHCARQNNTMFLDPRISPGLLGLLTLPGNNETAELGLCFLKDDTRLLWNCDLCRVLFFVLRLWSMICQARQRMVNEVFFSQHSSNLRMFPECLNLYTLIHKKEKTITTCSDWQESLLGCQIGI